MSPIWYTSYLDLGMHYLPAHTSVDEGLLLRIMFVQICTHIGYINLYNTQCLSICQIHTSVMACYSLHLLDNTSPSQCQITTSNSFVEALQLWTDQRCWYNNQNSFNPWVWQHKLKNTNNFHLTSFHWSATQTEEHQHFLSHLTSPH